MDQVADLLTEREEIKRQRDFRHPAPREDVEALLRLIGTSAVAGIEWHNWPLIVAAAERVKEFAE